MLLKRYFVLAALLLALPFLGYSVTQPANTKSHAATTSVTFNVFLHGIGKGGDSANPNGLGNPSPHYTQRTIYATIANAQNVVVASPTFIANYNAGSGSFTVTVPVTNLSTGVYIVKVRADRYLNTQVTGITQIISSTNNVLAPVYLVAGDVNGDNIVNIMDFNILMGCYADLKPATSCTAAQKIAADLTDDGNVNQLDYNLFIREISNRSGEGQPIPTVAPSPTPVNTTSITNLPPQPFALMYGDPTATDLNNAKAYQHPGALVLPGRVGYDAQVFKDVSSSGGHVLIYLDVMINASYGRYHDMLLNASSCGPAVPLWPGNPSANQWGSLNDIRVGGVLQTKLQCVLEAMVKENPHMAGWFADDVGSRSWYPNINWDGWSTADKQAYRDGAIAITKTFRKVADEHGLIFVVNGTWSAGTLASSGGGYPDMNQSGNALADGGVVEHHAVSEIPYFTSYACASQWASQSPIAKGKAFNLAITQSETERAAYAKTNCFAYVTNQTTDQYGQAPPPWGSFHFTGLPTKVSK